MAGSDPTTVTDIPLIDVDTLVHKIDSQQDLLRDILDTLRLANRAREVISLHAHGAIVTNTYVAHTRFFLEWLVISGHEILSAAGVTCVLNVGSATYDFHYDISLPIPIPLPIVLDRGIDVNVTFFNIAGAPFEITEAHIFLIGTVE